MFLASVFLAGFVLLPILCKIFQTWPSSVLFYRGVAFAGTICIAQIAVYLAPAIAGGMNGSSAGMRVCLAVVCFCINLCILVLFPVTIERSVTIYLLSQLRREGTLSPQQMQSLLIDRYVVEGGAVGRRIHEQIVSGNIRDDGTAIALSPRGKRLLRLFDVLGVIYGMPVQK